MQINPLLNSDSTIVFVGEDGRLGNVNLTSGLSQRMNGNLSFVSILSFIFFCPLQSRGGENSFAFEKLSMACMFRGEKLEFRLFCLEVYPIDKKLKVCQKLFILEKKFCQPSKSFAEDDALDDTELSETG